MGTDDRAIFCNLTFLALVPEAFGGRGGIAQYNRDFLQALAAAPWAGRILTLPRLARDPVGALPDKIAQTAPRAGRAEYALAAWSASVRLRPDVIYCGHLYMAPLAALLARRIGASLIVQLHGIEAWRRPNMLRRRALQAADLVICVSRDTMQRVTAWGGIKPEAITVLPNTVADDYTPGDGGVMRDRLGLREEYVLLSVSRLDARQRHKGQDRIIPLLPSLNVDGRRVIYLIAGEGDDRPRLEALARDHGVADQVRFLGYVPRSDLPDLYRAADLFVLPSTGEGFGIVFLEAMACGTPALGLAVGGATDALCDGVLGTAVAPEKLPTALTKAVTSSKPDPYVLSRAVQARFGSATFPKRVHEQLGRFA